MASRRSEFRRLGSATALAILASLPADAQSSRKGVWDASSGSASSTTQRDFDNLSQKRNYMRDSGSGSARTYSPTQRTQYPQATAGTSYSRQYQNSAQYQSQTSARGASSPAAAALQKGQLLDYRERLPDGRKFTVHLPHNYNGSSPLPVVLVFHGLGMSGDSVRALSAMDATAERYGFITVYPDAVSGRWNDGVQPRSTTDDVGFVSDMLDAITRKYKIDSRRIYACGISNGGFFVQRLACELSNRIAAIGVVSASGSYTVCSRCSTRRGMPVVFFLGTDDPLIPREGESKELGKLGEALGLGDIAGKASINSTVAKIGGVMTADDATEFWAHNNGCSANPRHEVLPDRDPRDGCKVTRDTYGGGVGGSDVVVYTIEGGGHNWPGGMGFVASDIIGRTTNDISANEIMWQFFQNRSR